MENPATVPVEALLEHTAWVRRLAHALVRDPDRAEDVVQEAWRVALEAPPRSAEGARAYLATVVRNAARGLWRGERSRSRREAAAARPEALPSTAELVERAQLHRGVVEAVLELEEPYRTTLLLRHFEDLGTAEIAERTGRPVNTVRTHIERGHARLRERLDREHGSREAWGLALLPLARVRDGAALSTTLAIQAGGIALMLKWTLAAAAAALAVVVAIQLTDPAPTMPEPVPAGSGAVASAKIGIVRTAPEAMPAERLRETVSAAPTRRPAPPSVDPVRLDGRLVDARGVALPGIELSFRDSWAIRRDGERLLFPGGGTLTLAPRTIEGLVAGEGDAVELLLADPEFSVGLRSMSSERGIGLRETAVQTVADPNFAELLRMLRGEGPPVVSTTTGTEGAFSVELPFEDWELELGDDRLVFVLEGDVLHADGRTETVFVAAPFAPVAGRVVDAEGWPVSGVSVALSSIGNLLRDLPFSFLTRGVRDLRLGTTGPDGRFASGAEVRVPLVEGQSVHCSGTEDLLPGRLVIGPDADRLDLELRLEAASTGAEAWMITGFVLDRLDTPVSGATVLFGRDSTITDETGRFRLEPSRAMSGDAPLIALSPGVEPAILEGLEPRLREDPFAGRGLVLRTGAPTRSLRGRVVDGEGEPVVGVQVRLVGGTPYNDLATTIEDDLAGVIPSEGVRTDAQGRFEYPGLFGESYGLRVLDEETFQVAEAHDLRPGAGEVRLVLDGSDVIPRVAGRVVDRRGRPVPGIQLSLQFTEFEWARGGSTFRLHELGVSDGRGEFSFEDVPHRGVTFVAYGAEDEIEWVSLELDPTTAHALEVEVSLRLRFRLDERSLSDYERLTIVDAAGERVPFVAIEGRSRSGALAWPREPEQGWPVFEVPDLAEAVVLESTGREPLQIPLHLEPGRVVIVR
jgi:RNA polymerase sigma factor (sigma-70 family)